MKPQERKERQIIGYPPKPIADKIKSYVNRHEGMTESSFITDAARAYLRNIGELPSEHRKQQ